MTVPEVFLSTEAAKFWVTPTKLVPSTSTIRSFTRILEGQSRRDKFRILSNSISVAFAHHLLTKAYTSNTPFMSPRSWLQHRFVVGRNGKDKWADKARDKLLQIN